jgi:hypothetical protein
VGALDAPLELVDAEAVLDEGDLELGDGGAAVSVGRIDAVAAHAVDVARTCPFGPGCSTSEHVMASSTSARRMRRTSGASTNRRPAFVSTTMPSKHNPSAISTRLTRPTAWPKRSTTGVPRSSVRYEAGTDYSG